MPLLLACLLRPAATMAASTAEAYDVSRRDIGNQIVYEARNPEGELVSKLAISKPDPDGSTVQTIRVKYADDEVTKVRLDVLDPNGEILDSRNGDSNYSWIWPALPAFCTKIEISANSDGTWSISFVWDCPGVMRNTYVPTPFVAINKYQFSPLTD